MQLTGMQHRPTVVCHSYFHPHRDAIGKTKGVLDE